MDRIYSVEVPKVQGCLVGKISSRIGSAPFIEYLKTVALFVTKEDTIKTELAVVSL